MQFRPTRDPSRTLVGGKNLAARGTECKNKSVPLPSRWEVTLSIANRQTHHLVIRALELIAAAEPTPELEALREAIIDLRPYLTIVNQRLARKAKRRQRQERALQR